MQPLRRVALSAARKARPPASRQSRRYAHDAHGHGHSPAPPVNEPMGMGFWVTFGTIPAGWALYKVSRVNDDGTDPWFTRLIARYMEAQDELAERNDRHVRMVEQAGRDRVLFYNTKPNEHIEMNFPEIMNVGSPFNVPAGHQVSMDKVIEKYQKMAYEENERKVELLRTNMIPSEQPIERDPRLYVRSLRPVP